MSTTIRPEISHESDWWISKHRYYELKHFCLQYGERKKLLSIQDGYSSNTRLHDAVDTGNASNPTERLVENRELLMTKQRLIEQSADLSSHEISDYIFKAVTEGLGYTALRMSHDMPCSKEMYYKIYRRFFYILSTTLDKHGL